MNDILLYYPGSLLNPKWRLFDKIVPKEPLRFPIAICAVGGYLSERGYSVKAYDGNITKYNDISYEGCLWIGVSVMSIGSMIKDALEFSKYVKSKHPDIPIVWGGIHPTLCPDSTIDSEYVDYVVRGEGEITAVELTEYLSGKRPIESVLGVTYKVDGEIHHTKDRKFINLDEISLPAFDLFDVKNYPAAIESFLYTSSRGCPFDCKFCYNAIYNKRKWRSRSAEFVVEDLRKIIDEYNPKEIKFFEDNFMVDLKRVKKILTAKEENGWDFKWQCTAKLEYFRNVDDDMLRLFERTGCSNISIGFESGSDRMLKEMGKKFQAHEILEFANRMKNYSIPISGTFICAIPNETKEDRRVSLQLIQELKRSNPAIRIIGNFIYSPLPGSEYYDAAIALGYDTPTTLEEWSTFDWSNPDRIPYISQEELKEIELYSFLIRYLFFTQTDMFKFLPLPLRIPGRLVQYVFKARLLHLNMTLPYEVKLINYLFKTFLTHF